MFVNLQDKRWEKVYQHFDITSEEIVKMTVEQLYHFDVHCESAGFDEFRDQVIYPLSNDTFRNWLFSKTNEETA
jgi:hypothetical protein